MQKYLEDKIIFCTFAIATTKTCFYEEGINARHFGTEGEKV